MGLEATVICVDNSAFMRNGDYIPTRLEAQKEAVNTLTGMKTQSNPESTVGLISTAGKRVEVLLSLTRDLGQIMRSLHTLQAHGKANLSSALKTAQLLLKNRQNKKQKQRIIVFVGSPIEQDQKTLTKVAKNMKKNNVAVDVINFGHENASNANQELMQAFIKAVNSGDNSRLVNIPPGAANLSDMIVSSILTNDGGAAGAAVAAAAAGVGGGDFGAVDPNIDPELAMALRMSLEEDRARQQREAEASGNAAAAAGGGDAAMTDDAPAAASGADAAAAAEDDDEEDEDALLQEAIRLSMAAEQANADGDQDVDMGSSSSTTDADGFKTPASKPSGGASAAPQQPQRRGRHRRSSSVQDLVKAYEHRVEQERTEAEALSPKQKSKPKKSKEEEEVAAALQDVDFLAELINDLPGVDPNEINVQELMENVNEDDKKKDGDKKDKDGGSA